MAPIWLELWPSSAILAETLSVEAAIWLIAESASPTTLPPSRAVLAAVRAASAASLEFLLTSSTVADISSMAVATWVVLPD